MPNNPKYNASDTISGIYQGIVVDVRDPFKLGRARIHSYALHGDYRNMDIDNLPWSRCLCNIPGSHNPPPLFAHAEIMHDAGDQYHPVIMGWWKANIPGRGILPYNNLAHSGTNIRPEMWLTRSLYPEGIMLGCSGDGNAIWFEDKLLNGINDNGNLASVIQIEDSGGKNIRTRSYHIGVQGYSPIDEVPTGISTLDQAKFGDLIPTRKGTEFEQSMPSITGSIEQNITNVQRIMQTDSSGFTIDSFVQRDMNKNLFTDQVSVGGSLVKLRNQLSNMTLANSSMFLNSNNGIFISSMMTIPQRWDI